MKNCLVYLSGPIAEYNGNSVRVNCEKAIAVYFELIHNDIPAFCPHFTALFPNDIDYGKWMEYDIAVIDRCTHMLMLEDWQFSKGAVQEFKFANEYGMPVYYSIEDLLKALT